MQAWLSACGEGGGGGNILLMFDVRKRAEGPQLGNIYVSKGNGRSWA